MLVSICPVLTINCACKYLLSTWVCLWSWCNHRDTSISALSVAATWLWVSPVGQIRARPTFCVCSTEGWYIDISAPTTLSPMAVPTAYPHLNWFCGVNSLHVSTLMVPFNHTGNQTLFMNVSLSLLAPRMEKVRGDVVNRVLYHNICTIILATLPGVPSFCYRMWHGQEPIHMLY